MVIIAKGEEDNKASKKIIKRKLNSSYGRIGLTLRCDCINCMLNWYCPSKSCIKHV